MKITPGNEKVIIQNICPEKSLWELYQFPHPYDLDDYLVTLVDNVWTKPLAALCSDSRNTAANHAIEHPFFHKWTNTCNTTPELFPLDANCILPCYINFYDSEQTGGKQKTILCRKTIGENICQIDAKEENFYE